MPDVAEPDCSPRTEDSFTRPCSEEQLQQDEEMEEKSHAARSQPQQQSHSVSHRSWSSVASSFLYPRISLSRVGRDVLPLILACLDMADFLTAIKVSRTWREAAKKKAAWPVLTAEHFVSRFGASREEYSSISSRCLDLSDAWHLRAPPKSISAHDTSDPATYRSLRRVLARRSRARESTVWQNANQLCWGTPAAQKSAAGEGGEEEKVGDTSSSKQHQPEDFRHLTALHLTAGHPISKERWQELTQALAPTLRVLVCENLPQLGKDSISPLHQLTQLRVLVLNCSLSVDVLRGLKQLEFLVLPGSLEKAVVDAIRLLSVEHQLRSLVVSGTGRAHWTDSLIEPPPTAENHHPARLTSLQLPWVSNNYDIHSLSGLPHLRHLSIGPFEENQSENSRSLLTVFEYSSVWTAKMAACLTRLESLQLTRMLETGRSELVFNSALRKCINLRKLTLLLASTEGKSYSLHLHSWLPALVHLEDFTLSLPSSSGPPHSVWSIPDPGCLASLRTLRRFTCGVRLDKGGPVEVFGKVLSELPCFVALTLTLFSHSPLFDASLALQLIASSSTWSSLEVHWETKEQQWMDERGAEKRLKEAPVSQRIIDRLAITTRVRGSKERPQTWRIQVGTKGQQKLVNAAYTGTA